MANPHERRFFGRKQSRPLRPARQEAIDKVLPKLAVPQDRITAQGDLNPADLFETSPAKLWLEIGFGQGEHLIGLLERDDNTAYIGAEPYIDGMSAFLKNLPEEHHLRVRVHMEDAVPLVQSLSDQSLDGIYVLNPDPWPKKRHHKRRIIQQETLKQFHRILKPGGELIMASDVDDLAEWMVTETLRSELFQWTAKSSADWKTRPDDWVITKYEEKGANHTSKRMSYLLFRRW